MNIDNKICPHYDRCGGCSLLHINYEQQLQQKKDRVLDLFDKKELSDYNFLGIEPSPNIYEYRNKMEFSFGDLELGGELQLGMHPRGRMFDVVTVDNCRIVDGDFRLILRTVLDYCREHNFKKYHVKRREGFVRHLVVRKGLNTGEILVNLVTTSQTNHDFAGLTERLINLDYNGELVGFLQTINDGYSDAVECDRLITHHGRSYYYEKLLGLKFMIKPFSFFQTNTAGAEQLYHTVIDFIEESQDKTIFDLYSGTGTIAQIVAAEAREVIGIEKMEEAVEMARENAELNSCHNCKFITGDVLDRMDELHDKPDVIIIDPPRPGIHPEALHKIIAAGAPEIVYVSCKPETQARDLEEFINENYRLTRVKAVDMFPHTDHIEVVTHLQHR